MSIFPVPILGDGRLPRVSDHFGSRTGTHHGADIMYKRPERGGFNLPTLSKLFEMPHGVPALAFEGGVVSRAGTIGTGGRVQIEHPSGLSTKYFHLRNLKVKKGDKVRAGQTVGTIYHNVAGFKLNHLHFEMFKNGTRINPEPILAKSQMVPIPGLGFGAKFGISVGIGLLAWKYVFK